MFGAYLCVDLDGDSCLDFWLESPVSSVFG